MKAYLLFLPLLIIACLSNCSRSFPQTTYESESMRLIQISKHAYIHTSFLETEEWGKVACHGMVVVDKGEAIVFDTPVDDASSAELIRLVATELRCEIKAVVATHFHIDCLGGLAAFHQAGATSYALQQTIDLARAEGTTNLPQHGFANRQELKVGSERVWITHHGAGHTHDNVVGYFPSEQVLFGGCLIKSVGAGKGNLADASVEDWSNTVREVKEAYPEAEVVIPGHGRAGGVELLDFTIELFDETTNEE